jgi:RNA polymerase sigma-70 factor (sigma-E family)
MSDRDEAFDVFVRSRHGRLLAVAHGLTGERGAAEDLLQEGLWQLYRHWDRVRVDEAREAYLIRTLVRAHARARQRRWHGERVSGLSADLVGLAGGRSDPEGDDSVVRVLAELPDEWRVVVVLRYGLDLSVERVAELLGRPVGTVKSQSSGGLDVLRSALGDQAEAERW